MGNGSSAFKINAENGNTFPWLSRIAASYDFYRFKRVKLVYVPLCSTSTAGRIMLGYDPDSADKIAVDRQALSSYSCSSEASVWGVIDLECKLSDTNKWYYSSESPSAGIGAYLDQGQVFFATWGGAGTTECGEWYVLYDVELKDPQPASAEVYQAYGGNGSHVVVQPFPAGASPSVQTADPNALKIAFTSPGTYWVAANIACTATSGITAGTGAALGANWFVNSGTTTIAFYNCTVFTGGAIISIGGLANVGHWTAYSGNSDQFSVLTY